MLPLFKSNVDLLLADKYTEGLEETNMGRWRGE